MNDLNPETLRESLKATELALIEKYSKDLDDQNRIEKAATISIGAGMYGYSLEAPMKLLVPALQSWARQIPRQTIPTGFQQEFKRITASGIVGRSTFAAGKRGSSATLTTDHGYVNFGRITSGVYSVDEDTIYAAGSYDNALARATSLALLNGMRVECAHIVGGNVYALGAPAITAGENSNVAGTLNASYTYYVFVRALTMMASQKALLAHGWLTPDATTRACAPKASVTVDLTDGYSAVTSASNGAAVATPGATHSIDIAWSAIPGAVAYAIFIGHSDGLTNATFQGVTAQCAVTLTSVDTGGSKASQTDQTSVDGYGVTQTIDTTGDTTADTNDYNGLLAQLYGIGVGGVTPSGCYLNHLGGKISSLNGTQIPEFQDMLTQVYLNQLMTDDVMLIIGGQVQEAINRAFGAGASTSVLRLVAPLNGPEQKDISGGLFVTGYIHPITKRVIPLVIDPNLWGGVALAVPLSMPYPNSGIDSPTKVWLSYDWIQREYAITEPTRNYENQVKGGVAVYAPLAYGIIDNIYNG
jgi:hypothetical protein